MLYPDAAAIISKAAGMLNALHNTLRSSAILN